MDHCSLQPHQEIMASQSLDSMLVSTKPQSQQQQQQQQGEKKARPLDQELRCPRCDSTNTKFCYYNNYSLSQPRYFCKSCRRYWTKGGTLRNVPVGGGCRIRTKRPSSSSSSSSRRNSNTPTSSSSSMMSSPNSLFLHNQFGGAPMGSDHYYYESGQLLTPLPIGNSLHHLYNYGFGGSGKLGNIENVGDNSVILSHEDYQMGSSTPIIKQEINGNYGSEVVDQIKVLWGDHEIDSLPGSWNYGVLNSSWQGLLNNPLM